LSASGVTPWVSKSSVRKFISLFGHHGRHPARKQILLACVWISLINTPFGSTQSRGKLYPEGERNRIVFDIYALKDLFQLTFLAPPPCYEPLVRRAWTTNTAFITRPRSPRPILSFLGRFKEGRRSGTLEVGRSIQLPNARPTSSTSHLLDLALGT
jgi:hypothetical protein